MKKYVIFLITLVLGILSTYGYDCKVADIYYNLNKNERTASVTYGEDPFYYSNYSGDVKIPSTIVFEGESYEVTSIDSYAFYRSNISSVIIGDNVTSIGEDAFCASLVTSVVIGKSVSDISFGAFFNCSNLHAITFRCKNINYEVDYIFDVFNIKSVYIGEEVEIIDWGSLYFNTTTSIYIENLSTWCSITFIGLPVIEDYRPDSYQKHTYEYYYHGELITDLVIPNDVTTINNGAFPYCNGLTTITIPTSVTSIGADAFRGCPNLNSLIIPNSVTSIGERAFAECCSLTSLVIDDSSEELYLKCDPFSSSPLNSVYLGRNINFDIYNTSNHNFSPFENQIQLTSVIIGENVTLIDQYAFYGCTGLTSVSIPNSITYIGGSAFRGCSGLTSLTIPNSVTIIGDNAFQGCIGLKSLTIDCSKIGTWFSYNTSLNELVIGNNVKTIGDYAFSGCSGLTSLFIGDSVTSISVYAFKGCTGLVSINIPNNITSIGGDAFQGCSGLTSVTIPNSVTFIGACAFQNCSSLVSLTIPNNTTYIRDSTFEGCRGLSSMTLPSSVITIGGDAFKGCVSLKTLTIPESVKNIGYGAFEGCCALTSVIIPKNVNNFGGNAFYGCDNLSFVKTGNDTPVRIPKSTFSNSSNAILFVPKGSKSSYQTADYWKDFKKIVEYIEGDVNSDGEVDVVDVVDIARYVVGTPSESFIEIMADINNDNTVNLGDAVTLVNDIVGDQNLTKTWFIPEKFATEDILSMSEVNGIISITLDNWNNYTAFQFEVFVSEGVDIARIQLNTKRKQGHQLLYNKIEDGHYSVAALSTSNQLFKGNDGELLNIALNEMTGSEVKICNIHFFDSEGHDYLFDDIVSSTTTEIQSSENKELEMAKSIYDLQGIKRENPQRGINIVGGKKVVVQ